MTTNYTIKNKTFNVFLKGCQGNDSILTHKNKTSWCYKTAKKHLLDCVSKKMNAGMFKDVEYFAIVAS